MMAINVKSCAASYFWLIESSTEQHLFETEIFCNIINGFTDTFGQFNASMLNKYNNSESQKSYWPHIFEQ